VGNAEERNALTAISEYQEAGMQKQQPSLLKTRLPPGAPAELAAACRARTAAAAGGGAVVGMRPLTRERQHGRTAMTALSQETVDR
jgi:hypothetical protein